MKNILFFGGASLLSNIWARYWRTKYRVFVGINKRKITIEGTKSIDLQRLDNLKEILLNNKITHIINCAGLTSVEECQENPELAYSLNGDLPGYIAKITSDLNIKFIQISTDHLFDGEKKNYSEQSTPSPLNIYSKSKLDGEKKTLFNNSNSLIIRTNFFGNGPAYRHSFSDRIINDLTDNKNIYLFEDVYYTPISVNILADCVEKLMGKELKGIYNVVGNERITKYDFGLKIADLIKVDRKQIVPISINQKKDLVIRPKDMSLDNERLLGSIKYTIPELSNQLIDVINNRLDKC